MIRIRHVTLPPGLSAFVRRGASDDLEVFVSDELEPARARAAVRLALRSFQSGGTRSALLPVPLGLLLAGGAARLRSITSAIRAHAVMAAAVATGVAVIAATALLLVLPHQHGPIAAGGVPEPGSHARASASSPALTKPHLAHGVAPGRAARPGQGKPAVPTLIHSTSPPAPRPGSSSPATGPAPRPSSPAPQPSGSGSPSPTPTPSPSTTAGGGGGPCVVLLGVWICLRAGN
jgi:hypothetical protein